MAVEVLQDIYEGANLSGAVNGVVSFRIEKDCTIIGLMIFADENVSGADAIFNLSQNGADLFSGSGRPKIIVGADSGALDGLEIEAAKGDKMILNLVSGAVVAPLTLLLEIDDGVSSGGALPAGDLSAENKLDKVQNRPIIIPEPGEGALSDEFNDALDTNIWNASGTVSITGEKAQFGADGTLRTDNLYDVAGKTIIVKTDNTGDGLIAFVDDAHGQIIQCKQYINLAGIIRITNNYSGGTQVQGSAGFSGASQLLRVRFIDDVTFFDYSNDNGSTWTGAISYAIPAGMDLQNVNIAISSVADGWKVDYIHSDLGFDYTDAIFIANNLGEIHLVSKSDFCARIAAEMKAAIDALP